jgi:hypothetical protein
MKVSNTDKTKIFAEYLGERFKTFEVASPDSAPVSFVATDHEDKQYFVYVEIPKEEYVSQRENTGIAIENAHFYQLYAMMSQGQNVFWYVAFSDGFMLFYLNDCLTPEQLNVLPEQTLIGAASALHIHKDKIKHKIGDGSSYATVAAKPNQPTIIGGSLDLKSPIGRKPKARVNKRKK